MVVYCVSLTMASTSAQACDPLPLPWSIADLWYNVGVAAAGL